MDDKLSTSSDPEDLENIIINEVDGLPNLHPNLKNSNFQFNDDQDCDNIASKSIEDLVNDEDLPTSVIVTNVDPRVFKSDELKVNICYFYKKALGKPFSIK